MFVGQGDDEPIQTPVPQFLPQRRQPRRRRRAFAQATAFIADGGDKFDEFCRYRRVGSGNGRFDPGRRKMTGRRARNTGRQIAQIRDRNAASGGFQQIAEMCVIEWVG